MPDRAIRPLVLKGKLVTFYEQRPLIEHGSL